MELPTEEKNKKQINFKLWDPKRDARILKFVVIGVIFSASVIAIKDEILWQTGYYDDILPGQEDVQEPAVDNNPGEETCNVAGLELHGDLVTYISPADLDSDGNLLYDETASENIAGLIRQAEKDDKIKAIILEVDSYGGLPVAAEEVANVLKRAKKPSVALIRSAGASAAYWSATGANEIFASRNADVGSIGVTMSYLDYSKKNQTEGLIYQQISSGKFKDAGDPDRPLTNEEK